VNILNTIRDIKNSANSGGFITKMISLIFSKERVFVKAKVMTKESSRYVRYILRDLTKVPLIDKYLPFFIFNPMIYALQNRNMEKHIVAPIVVKN
jgi:hypothetical protein